MAGEIVNRDQGSQFTSAEWIGAVETDGSRVNPDGRGRAWDNVRVERLWRSVKDAEIYLRDDGDPAEARTGLRRCFGFDNTPESVATLARGVRAASPGAGQIGVEAAARQSRCALHPSGEPFEHVAKDSGNTERPHQGLAYRTALEAMKSTP